MHFSIISSRLKNQYRYFIFRQRNNCFFKQKYFSQHQVKINISTQIRLLCQVMQLLHISVCLFPICCSFSSSLMNFHRFSPCIWLPFVARACIQSETGIGDRLRGAVFVASADDTRDSAEQLSEFVRVLLRQCGWLAVVRLSLGSSVVTEWFSCWL